MEPSSRDRISVDLRGLKTALFERARDRGTSPSEMVRRLLAEGVGQSDPSTRSNSATAESSVPIKRRARLSLRMSSEEALATLAAARQAGMSPGAFVAGLVAGVPAIGSGARRADYLAALIGSSAELSTLSRNIHHLTSLLRQAQVRPALEYREMLDALADDVRAHLSLAANVLADLQPRSRRCATSKHKNC